MNNLVTTDLKFIQNMKEILNSKTLAAKNVFL